MQLLWNKADRPPGDFFSTRPNRRWSVRQKIHTPAYISVNPCDDGTIFGLNEIYDIGTDGLSFQGSEPLNPGSRVRLNLELSDGEGPVHATGRVVWSEPSGRTGIQLRKSSLSSPRRLDEYLFLNAITACSHYEALQSGKDSTEARLPGSAGFPAGPADPAGNRGSPDYPAVLAWLTQISGELDSADSSLGPPWQKLADRLCSFLDASGVAIAISSGDEMFCRACAGAAPAVGTQFHSGVGFSGECVRSGVLMFCDDAETDPRVDHGVCLALDIRSIIAAPVRSERSVVGLIEAFSPQPHAFNRNVRVLLERMAEMVSRSLTGAIAVPPRPDVPSLNYVDDIVPVQAEVISHQSQPRNENALGLAPDADLPDELFSSRLRRIAVLGGAATLLVAATLMVPWMRTRASNGRGPGADVQPASFQRTAFRQNTPVSPVAELKQLRQLAESGDANAQFALGARYATGDGVTQNYGTAARWFSLAANQGSVVAQATLGAYYWAGRGVPEDLHKAYFWSVLAQAGGDQGSRFRLASLASRLSHAEVVIAQEQANQWIERHQLGGKTAVNSGP